MKTVIIEGTDNVGKDTIINRLTEEFKHNVVIHCEKPENDTPLNQSLKQENTFAKLLGENIYYNNSLRNNKDFLFIHNRSWYGEYVYGCMYRKNDEKYVKNMIFNLELLLNNNIDENDIVYITLLSDNMDFLVRNDDGLSLSDAKKELIEEETRRFEKIYILSTIKNKHIVYVNNGDKFRDKDDIYNEVKKYIGL
jgi:thymidylate kinase